MVDLFLALLMEVFCDENKGEKERERVGSETCSNSFILILGFPWGKRTPIRKMQAQI